MWPSESSVISEPHCKPFGHFAREAGLAQAWRDRAITQQLLPRPGRGLRRRNRWETMSSPAIAVAEPIVLILCTDFSGSAWHSSGAWRSVT